MGARERLIVQETPDAEFTKAMVTTYSEEQEIFLAEKMVDEKRWILCWNKKKAEDDKAFRDRMLARSLQDLKKIQKGCGKRNLKTKEQVYHTTQKVIERDGTKRYITLEINKRGAPRLSFKLNDEQIDKERILDGKYILETSENNLSRIEIVQAYHTRDVVEKFFQMLKDIVELRPSYVYTEQHVKAHVFLCVLAVLLLSLLRKMLKKAGKDTMTSVKALDILDGIKRVEFSLNEGKNIIIRTTTFTDTQRELISILNVGPLGL
jgi:transposase